jgi:hypothetical protein
MFYKSVYNRNFLEIKMWILFREEGPAGNFSGGQLEDGPGSGSDTIHLSDAGQDAAVLSICSTARCTPFSL